MPLVSTIIPAYNRPEMLRRAVESVLAQTYRPIEIIISDDGSTDGTPEMGRALEKAHPDIINYIWNPNRGPGPARESGRQLARGEFIQYLDSDDYLMPEKFAKQVNALNDKPQCSIAYGISSLVDESGKVLVEKFKWTAERFETLYPKLLIDRWWCTHTPLYRRSACDVIGPWSDLRYSQDWEYDSRHGANRIKLAYCDLVVSCHCTHAGTRQTGKTWLDPQGRVRFLSALYKNALKAGVPPDAPEMRHFVRWAFHHSRQCALLRETGAAEACLLLAIEADGGASRDLRLYRLLARVLGPRVAAQCGGMFGRLAGRQASQYTLRQSWMDQSLHPAIEQKTRAPAVSSISDCSNHLTSSVKHSLVSTIIPAYNRPQMLQRAVESVLAQTYRPIEVIISDDGSTDGTPAMGKALEQAHPGVVKYIWNSNRGAGLARESGRQLAQGEFIQYLDSDDCLLPRKFEIMVAALREHPECGAAYGFIRFCPEGQKPWPQPYKCSGQPYPELFPRLLYDRWWNTDCPLFRRTVCDAVGPWTDLRYSQDWEYDGRVGALKTRLVHCPEFVCEQYDHGGVRQTAKSPWLKPPDRVRFFRLMFQHGRQAGVGMDTPEMRHFARWTFLNARQCGLLGDAVAAKGCLDLALEAGNGTFKDVKVYRLLASAVGWRMAAQLASVIDRVRGGKTSSATLPQSWMERPQTRT